MNIPLEM